jgi:hypothetical protein
MKIVSTPTSTSKQEFSPPNYPKGFTQHFLQNGPVKSACWGVSFEWIHYLLLDSLKLALFYEFLILQMNNIQSSRTPFSVFSPQVISLVMRLSVLHSENRSCSHFCMKRVNEYGRFRKSRAEQVLDTIF